MSVRTVTHCYLGPQPAVLDSIFKTSVSVCHHKDLPAGKYTILILTQMVIFVYYSVSGDAEWATLSEQERQKRLVKLKLEERRLRKEGQLDELHRLLGEGFEMDANLRKLMGENKARYVSGCFW